MASGNVQDMDVYEFLLHFAKKNGYPPSLREIGEGVGLSSTSTVAYHLHSLRDKGYVKWNANHPRTLTVVPRD